MMMEYVIFPLLFFLVTEMILGCVEVNNKDISGPSTKAFMDDGPLVTVSRSHMEQLATRHVIGVVSIHKCLCRVAFASFLC